MGSGKSTWAINYINSNPQLKFMCIVPLLDECERFKEKQILIFLILKNGG